MPDLSAKLPLSTAIRPLAVEDLACRYAARQTPAQMDISLQPGVVSYLENGKVTYTGSVEGLMQTADYKAVKLPAPVVIERMRGMRAKPPAAPAPSARADAPAVVEFEGVSFNYPAGPPVLRGGDL